MIRKRIIVMVVLLAVLGSAAVFADYDSGVVKQVMRDNVSLMGDLNKAIKDDDFMAAGKALLGLADGAYTVKAFDAPRGSQRDWNATWDEFILAAFKGMGAVADEDSDGLDDAFKTLKKLNGQGHKSHK